MVTNPIQQNECRKWKIILYNIAQTIAVNQAVDANSGSQSSVQFIGYGTLIVRGQSKDLYSSL